MNLAVCGHTNLDVQITVRDLPGPGNSSPVLQRRTVHGGTACNIAYHAAALGVPTRLWSRVGIDFPVDWRSRLEGAGLDLSYLSIDETAVTPTCFVISDQAGQQSYLMDQGAMGVMGDHPPTVDLLEGMELPAWLHLATGDPYAYVAIAKAAKKRGIHVALDPGQELRFLYDDKVFSRLLNMSHTLFLNENELSIALEMLRYGDPMQLLDHVERLVVTRGADGAVLYRRKGKPLDQDAPPVDAVQDSTGAGDALRAGWYAGLAADLDEADALRRGQQAAAQVVQMQGPQERPVHRVVTAEE